ncbi:MAG: Flp pilus assembly complex ATPase component TadA [Candidatus Gastranaerophilales bacterium]|nr:Flp pilus assembly complex ATPase component TadA [Candidatus Gastranaerophilales bacterium]
MDNSTITKLIKKINFDLANHFELSATKELSFVPVNMQKNITTGEDVFFVAVCKNSDQTKIKDYVSKYISNSVSFIKMSPQDFNTLYDTFLKRFSEIHGGQLPPSLKTNIEDTIDLDNDDDLNILDEDLEIEDEISGDNIFAEDSKESNESDSAFDSDYDNQLDDDDFNQEEDEEDYGLDGKPKADITQVKAPETKKLGEILIEEKLINEEQLQIALAESKSQGIPLGSILVKLGFVTIKDLKEALGAQMGLKYATAEQLKTLPTAISILPEDFIRFNKVIPLSMTDRSLVIGMVNPNDTKVINEIVYQTGLKPTVMLVTHVEFENFINTYYSADKEETNELLQQINEDESLTSNGGELWDQVEQEIQDSDGAVSQLANKIITMAIDRRASDIHIEPLNVGYRVRMRIDGSLQEAIQIPAKVDSAVISRFKVLSKMNIAEHRRAQDGSFTLKYKNKAQDFRVNTLPVAGREKMVIRVLAPQMDSKQAKADKIEVVGASEDDIKKIRFLVSSPNGIVLTAGPTGSGKTTTLYALLRYMNSDDVNITTIEDPVEIKLEGINQSSINTKAGITFANSLRAILRQDPDTILIGEIRDYETLEVAISASLTGHLVLSTIHTNSAAATITRLIEMGAKDYLISSTLSGVIAQRLVKKLCPNCKEAYFPSVEEARKILTDPVEIQKLTKTKLYRPHGCPNCKNSGYLGRLAVLEIMVINNEIRKMIAQRAHDVELEDYAIKQGMKTLRMSCLRHILEGNTSIEEQVRILGLAGE